MPKIGLGTVQWVERLKQYARGKYSFGRGERPPKGSRWDIAVAKIDKCPKQGNPANYDPFGRLIRCTCGYHPQVKKRPTIADPSTSIHIASMDVEPGSMHTSSQSQVLSPSTTTPQMVAAVGFAPQDSMPTTRSPPPQMVAAVGSTPQDPVSTTTTQLALAVGQQVSTTLGAPETKSHCQPIASASQQVPGPSTATKPIVTTQVPIIEMMPAGQQIPLPTRPSASPLPRQPTDFSLRLPQGWRINVAEQDRNWLGRVLFVSKGKLTPNLKLWWYPPARTTSAGKPNPGDYFMTPLFLWMPRKMWAYDFHCPNCGPKQSLTSKGVYRRCRKVLDIKGYYYLACEMMECKVCSGAFLAWDERMLAQLSPGVRAQFPAILTRKYACDEAVVSLLRNRTLGNSPTALRNSICELHSEEWLRRQVSYLSDCQRHLRGIQGLISNPQYEEVPPFPSFPKAQYFLAAYVRDVYRRLPALLAAGTSIHGTIIKIDSTYKVCKKLQGTAANTANMATNVGNEKGEILQCVLTTSESLDSLQMLANGLMDRYEKHQQPHPLVLYTDRDCCTTTSSKCKLSKLFCRWPNLQIRLDTWHFMRRMGQGCTTESHPLYGTFMSQLSSCIFEWDAEDYQQLLRAKEAELVAAGIQHPSSAAVRKAVTSEELARHCRRRTRGEDKTVELMETLLSSLFSATDTLGNPLFREEISEIWMEQKKHVACLQDPPDIPLYTITGHLKKGGLNLPVYRCARGTTSLESFHSHLVKFIPGTSANAVNFQAYLLDGITRWNGARTKAALSPADSAGDLRTFDYQLQAQVNSLSESVHNKKLLPSYQPPAQYTGEFFGVEYLYRQSGDELITGDIDIAAQIDEGFEEFREEVEDLPVHIPADAVENPLTVVTPSHSDSESEEEEEEDSEGIEAEQDATDSCGIPGWDKVDALALALIAPKGLSVTAAQAQRIVEAYGALLEYDKRPVQFQQRIHQKPLRGRFARSRQYSTGHVKMKRCFLSGGMPACSPSRSRIVEAIIIHLFEAHTQPRREVDEQGKAKFTSRYKLVLSAYNAIRARVLNSTSIMQGTKLMLINLNEYTLLRWYKNSSRRDESRLLMQGLTLPQPEPCATDTLPPPQVLPASPPAPPEYSHMFEEAPDQTGKARVRDTSSVVIPVAPLPHTTDTTPIVQTSTSTTLVATTSTTLVATTSSSTSSTPTSRVTQWRHRKAGKDKDTIAKRKVYCCSVCNQPVSSKGHTQYRGYRYCPYAPGQVPQAAWLAEKKAKFMAKKAT